jgi:gliding motility-associated-like protein
VTVTETATGCTNTASAEVAVRMPSTGDTVAVACETFDWYEHTGITQSCENLTHTFVGGNAQGCDSTVTLHLTVNHPVHVSFIQEQCGGTYTWESGNGQEYSVSGDYTYPHSDANGCTQVDTLHLTINPVPEIPVLSVTDNTSCLEPNGTITVTSPVGDGYSYSLDGVDFQTGVLFGGLGNDTYTVTVRNAFGCLAQNTAEIETVGSTVTASAEADSPCLGGDIVLTASSETDGVTYSWTGPDGFSYVDQNPTIPNADQSMNGTYTVTVTETATGCTNTASTEVAVRMPSTGDTVAVACETFDWYEHTGITQSCDNLTHTFVGGNAAGCDSTVTLHLTVNHPVHASFVQEQCGGTYTWESGDGQEYSVSGDYTYPHSDANGCTQVDTLHLTINPVPEIPVLSVTDNTSCLEPNGTITVTSPVGEGYSYSLDGVDFQTGVLFSGLGNDTYTVTVRNAFGCLAQNTAEIETVGSTVTAFAEADSPCLGGDIVLTASSQTDGVTYSWTGPDGFSSNDQNPTIPNAEQSMNGTYTVTVTETATGCTNSASAEVAVRMPSTGDTTAVACETFDWYEHTGITQSCDNLTHTFVGGNAQGCDSTVTLHLTVNHPVHVSFVQEQCGGTYTWTDGDGQEYAASGDYTYPHSDANGCTQVDTLHLTIHPVPEIPILSVTDNTSCLEPNGTITVTSPVGEGYSYSLDGVNFQTEVLFGGLGNDTYTVTVRNAFGCLAQNTAEIETVGSTVTATAEADSPCLGGDIVLTASSQTDGVTYSWTGPDGFSSVDQNPTIPNASTSMNGTYTVTVTETATGCTNTASAEVAVRMPSTGDTVAVACETFDWYEHTGITQSCENLTHTFVGGNAQGCDSTVTLHLTVNHPVHASFVQEQCGGTYTWETGDGQEYSVSGDYTYPHSDANGCTQVDTLHLTINPVPETPVLSVTDNTSCLEPNGTITVTSPVGEGYSYSLDGVDFQTGVLFGGLGNDTYTVTVRNAFGCLAQNTAEIETVGSTVTASAEADSPCLGGDIVLTASSQTDGVTYSWTGPNGFSSVDQNPTIPNANASMNGTYSVTVTETATGCTNTASAEVAVRMPSTGDTTAVACETFDWYEHTGITQSCDNLTHTFVGGNAAGCDSTVTLHLTVNYSKVTELDSVVCDSYQWNDSIYYQSGDYTQQFLTAHGCDSTVTMHLTVHYSADSTLYAVSCDSYQWNDSVYDHSGDYTQQFQTVDGCDSIVTLHLTVNYSATHEFWQTSCYNYTWNDVTYDSTGHYTQTLQTADGCDSVVTLHLTINDTIFHQFEDEACNVYTWNDSTYYVSGEYTQTFTSQSGCDSIVTLHLTLYYDTATTWSQSSCDSFVWNDSIYYMSGDYVQHFEGVHGCDSTVTLHLTLYHSADTAYSAEACNSYQWNDSIYDHSGDYTQLFQTIHGCDSTVTLHLTIYHDTTTEFSDTNCYTYTWNDSTYTQSGDYTQTLTNIHGCDSVVTLHLTINDTIFSQFDTASCNSFTWNGVTYTQSGEFRQTFSPQNSCDSVVTMNLIIYHDTATVWSDSACEQFVWNDSIYYVSGDHVQHFQTIHGCDSTVTLQLTIFHTAYSDTTVTAFETFTWHGVEYTETPEVDPTYTIEGGSQHGCDSVITLHLTITHNAYSDTTAIACESFTWHGIEYTDTPDTFPTFTIPGGSSSGNDSIIVLHLTINHKTYGDTTVVACETFTWHGETYTQTPAVAPTYTMVGGNANGCDSIVTLHLTVNHQSFGDTTAVACETFTWHGQTYTQTPTVAPTYTMVGGNANGCDSIVTLHLTVNHQSFGDTTAVACETFTWHGQTYTQTPTVAPTYTMVGGNHSGCDSIVTLHLTVNHNAHSDTTAVACETFTWHGQTYTETPATAPTFTIAGGSQNGCDSIITLHLTIYHTAYGDTTVSACESFTWHGVEYTETPDEESTFTIEGGSQHGCDSIVTLHLTIHHPVHTAITDFACGPYEWNGYIYSESGTYTFAHLDEYGCEQVDTLHLSFIDTAIHIINHTARFCDEGSAVLEVVTSLENYLWSTGETTQAITVFDEGTYSVTATQGECSVQAQITINPCEREIILPNAFSPDGDGINDDFGIPEALLNQINDYGFQITVINRWGNVVFTSSDKHFRWNGEVNGKVYHDNIYNYVIDYKTRSGAPRHLTGSVITL